MIRMIYLLLKDYWLYNIHSGLQSYIDDVLPAFRCLATIQKNASTLTLINLLFKFENITTNAKTILMISTQDIDICNTQVSKIFVTTTGISSIEIELIKEILPDNIVIQDKLSSSTNYLLTYRCIFTPKYIQAIKWRIPVVRIIWIYDTSQSLHRIQTFENTNFSTSNITNDIFKNYFIIQGATYSEDVHRATDFLISEELSDEKTEFCKKYKIPIVSPKDVFKNDLSLFSGNFVFNAQNKNLKGIFADKVFLIDPNLPPKLFNRLKRLIISKEGTRVSVEDTNVDFVISDSFRSYKHKSYFYQFVFDCVESNSFLLADFYEIRKVEKLAILENCTCYISKDLTNNKDILTNKLVAMGARVKNKLDFYCNYIIVKNKNQIKKNIKQKIVTMEAIDECLYSLKPVFVNENLGMKSVSSILRRPHRKNEVTYLNASKEKIFQFTGLATHFKKLAIEMCLRYQIRYFDCESYESCTHLIMGKLNTSEKFLSAIANGAWIIKPNFIEDFDNNENFNFEKYEWNIDENTPESEIKIIQSIPKWRKYVMKTGKPAFYKWIVKLYCDEKKVKNYERILINGGAKITDSSDFNQCFVSKNYNGNIRPKNSKTTDAIFAYLFKKQ